MKKNKIYYGLILISLFVSCNSSMEADAIEMAKIICESKNDLKNAAQLMKNADNIIKKYNGSDKEKFGQLVLEKTKNCLGDINTLPSYNHNDLNQEMHLDYEDNSSLQETMNFDETSYSE